MTKLTGIITSESKLEGNLGVRNEINVSIIGTGPRGLQGNDGYTPIKNIDYFDGIDGKDGKEIELQKTSTHIQWRVIGEVWKNLVPLSEIAVLEGDKGDDGYTPIKGIDYFDGIDGKDGKDGYTPQKGVDYYTDADKAEMVSAILPALPVYEGEVESV